ncbi:MAG: hypothetical protein KDE55_16920 [Novosphingobium sp.]|nr:hypothetical protein [Novosphingobium sp.]
MRASFAVLTMALEDLHGVTVEGQQADLSPDMQAALLSSVRDGVRKISRIMLDIAETLP